MNRTNINLEAAGDKNPLYDDYHDGGCDGDGGGGGGGGGDVVVGVVDGIVVNEDATSLAPVPLGGESMGRKLNYSELIKKRLPICEWLPHYKFSTFLQDLLAGFSVALTEIPQGIAYAGIAGLPLQYGLYCGFMGGFVYLIFGSCKDINIGPTSIMALMIQSHVTKMGYDMGIIITFLSGIVVFILGLLQLGFVVDFFSYPIIAGFTSAAALNIASSQIKGLLGLKGKANAFLEAWSFVFKHIKETRKWDTILGVLTIIFLIILKELGRFGSLKSHPQWSTKRNFWMKFIFMISLGRNALAVIIGTLLAYYIRDNGEVPFKITGEVDGGLPQFRFPPFNTDFNGTHYNFYDISYEFGTSLIFIPLVAILESIAIGKAFSKGRKLDATQEMIALGICNIIGSFVRSMPVTGSFTRTAVNNASGVKTTVAGVITGIMVLLALGLLTSSFYYIPKATLAAVIICSMFYLFDFSAFIILWRTKKIDLIPFLVTLFTGLFISLEYGILLGIVINLLFILYAIARPKVIIKSSDTFIEAKVFIIEPKDTIHFPAIEYLRDLILECNDSNGVFIVLDGTSIGNMDATVAKVLAVLVNELALKNQKLLFLNFKQSIKTTCIGIDNKLEKNFCNGDLKDVIKEHMSADIPTGVYSVQNH